MNIKKSLKRILKKENNKIALDQYYSRYVRHSFQIRNCKNEKQYEACITRLYHTIEKGLAYLDFRPGFGKENLELLLSCMESYAKGYDLEKEFYQTALNVLMEYIKKNHKYNYVDKELEERINALPGKPNSLGGIFTFLPLSEEELSNADYKEFFESRHSMRHFSTEGVELEKIYKALHLAQLTPSACNRQGWKTYIISDKELLKNVLSNQNGNRGFGQEIDKLLLVTADLRCFNYDRELFQAYIDGGMYAMSVINGLHYEHIATIPLSASLSQQQENNIRALMNLDDAEVLILFIGVGNYPNECQTTKSDRHDPVITVL